MKRSLLAGLVLLAAASGAAEAAGRWGEGYMPNLPVITQDGKERLFYDDLIKGKTVVISFVFTSCTDMCPLTTARLKEVQEKLGDAVGRDVFFVALSVDPEHDTPERMKAYADAFDAGPGWLFATGKPEDMRAITRKLGDRSTPETLYEHRNEVVLGNDATGEWQRDTAMGDLDRLVIAIRQLDPKWNRQVRIARYGRAGDAGYVIDNRRPGTALFKKVCAPCHSVGAGDRVGPDLRDVTARRDRDWLLSFIRNPAKLRTQNDPVALSLTRRFPGVRMPTMGVSEADAKDLLSFLEAETARLGADAAAAPAADRPHHER
jgi:protein SCO1